MKKVQIFLTLMLVVRLLPAQEKTLQKAADKTVPEIVKALEDVSPDSKIAFCYFLGSDSKSDVLKTRLGMRLSQRIYFSLRSALTNSNFELFFPENPDNKMVNIFSDSIWIPPNTKAEEEKFMDKYHLKYTPDYYLIGHYQLSNDNKTLTIYELSLYTNKHKLENKDLSIKEQIMVNINNDEIKELAAWNIPESDYVNDMLNFMGTAKIFNFSIMDEFGKVVTDKDPLYIYNDYKFKVSLSKPAYVYIFYYPADEADHPFFDLVEPAPGKNLKKRDAPLLEAKDYTLPENFLLNIDKPAGTAKILVIASLRKIPFDYDIIPLEDGYYNLFFKSSHCKEFLTIIKAYQPDNFQVLSITKTVKEKTE